MFVVEPVYTYYNDKLIAIRIKLIQLIYDVNASKSP